jgi:hypothetical protein
VTTPAAVDADQIVWVVVYGEDVHTYQGARAEESARALYAVGLAAFGDDNADIYQLTTERWQRARRKLPNITVHTH